jgi:simple sugar transport system permease protein
MSVVSGEQATSSSPEGPAPSRGRALGGNGMTLLQRALTLREASIIVVILVTFAYFAITANNFLTSSNFKALLPYFCFLAVMASGQVFVMTLGEIDLSVGAHYLFTPILYWKFNTAGIPLLPSLLLALVVAAALGVVSGFFTAYVGMPSFVATLAMLFFLDGLALILTHSQQVTTPGASISGLHVGTFTKVFGEGTYSELLWAVGIVAILQVVLSFTRWGTYTVATGGNRLGAAEAGIHTRFVIVRNFVLCATTAGFAGLLESIRTSSITPDPSGSNEFLLYSIAAVIIGGTLMTGGEGTVVGALLGALFIGILQDGLVVKGVSATYEDLYIGIAVVIAMTIYVLVRRIRLRSGRA